MRFDISTPVPTTDLFSLPAVAYKTEGSPNRKELADGRTECL